MSWTWFRRLTSPVSAYRLATRFAPWLAWTAGVLIAGGLFVGWALAPPGHQSEGPLHIIYVYLPSAWLAIFIFATMGIASAAGLMARATVAYAIAAACAPIGASFTVAALLTGVLWGRPRWGSYWVWDPQLTAELVLLFVYLGYIGLRAAFDDTQRADRASGIFALVGLVDLPIVHFSVTRWNSWHQGPSVMMLGKPTTALPMSMPLFILSVGFTLYFLAVLAVRMRSEVLQREHPSSRLREILGS